MMHFLSHPEFQATDPGKVKKLEIDYEKPIGLIVNVQDPENGKKEYILIDGNHRTRKAVKEKHDAKYIVVSNPDDVNKFMEFDKSKSHNLFPDDIDEIVKLNEIADSPYTFSSPKEEKSGNFDNHIDYTFTTDGGREYYIRFGSRWVGRSKKNDQKYNWATELTFFPTKLSHVGDPGEVGGENFGKILATVTKALKEFVQKYKPEYVFWKGIKTDKESEKGNTVDVTKRQRIYNAVMDRTVSGMSNYKSTKGNARSSIEYEKEIPVQGSDDIFKYPEEPSIDNPADNAKKLARFNLSR